MVEAPVQSSTVRAAAAESALGKRALAVPGIIFSPLSAGCHHLLKRGFGLVRNADDVLIGLGLVDLAAIADIRSEVEP